jgi:hypothetical protein
LRLRPSGGPAAGCPAARWRGRGIARSTVCDARPRPHTLRQPRPSRPRLTRSQPCPWAFATGPSRLASARAPSSEAQRLRCEQGHASAGSRPPDRSQRLRARRSGLCVTGRPREDASPDDSKTAGGGDWACLVMSGRSASRANLISRRLTIAISFGGGAGVGRLHECPGGRSGPRPRRGRGLRRSGNHGLLACEPTGRQQPHGGATAAWGRPLLRTSR